ncbi:protein CPR-5 [Coffea eugenioides]|uniref:protein CPR-5 n=1 Tax=Coffea eugenioides TaxID=49369 RepID=UPI000F61522A|nr:protein CPR-5 [Coffea eugenioides]
MDAPPSPPLQVPPSSHNDAVDSSNPMAQISTASSMSEAINGSEPTNRNTEGKKKKKQNHHSEASSESPSSWASSSGFRSTASLSHSSAQKRGIRLFGRRPNPKIFSGPGRAKPGDDGALALPLGMSIAAIVAQVLKRKDTTDEHKFVDHLSQICAAAVRESLVNVYGDNFDCFVENFEKSFRSTLMTLHVINKSTKAKGTDKGKAEICSSEVMTVSSANRAGNCGCDLGVKECLSDPLLAAGSHEQPNIHEEIAENTTIDPRNNSLTVHDQQITQNMAFITPSRSSSGYNSQSVLSTFEKSIIEQVRSNDLKEFEMGLTVKKLQLKERQLALSSHANFLERSKLAFGFSKASFKVEKFKTQLGDVRHAELLRKCIDCLVVGLFVMLGCAGYGVFVYSHKRISEATASCSRLEESKSWWMPKSMASFNSGMQILKCQFQVVTRMLAGGFMVLAIAYLLLQRSATSNQAMPVTFIVLLLAVACGFAGKLCIDTLGGSGNHWLVYWEVLCSLHFLSNLWTSMLFAILHGPINVSEGTKNNPRFPYWLRRCLFYSTVSLFLPLLCGFLPFASLDEWKDHFSSLLMDSED